jgi:hypothetical protein
MQLVLRFQENMNLQKSRDINYCKVLLDAHEQLKEELFNEEVVRMKNELRSQYLAKRWWHRLFPFTIKIERRK